VRRLSRTFAENVWWRGHQFLALSRSDLRQQGLYSYYGWSRLTGSSIHTSSRWGDRGVGRPNDDKGEGVHGFDDVIKKIDWMLLWSRFVNKYNCAWRNADWPASWHISTKSYQWQWKCGCSLTSCPGRSSRTNIFVPIIVCNCMGPVITVSVAHNGDVRFRMNFRANFYLILFQRSTGMVKALSRQCR